MTEEEKKQLADATKAAADAKKALDDAKAAHTAALAEKDAIIEQKNQDLVGIRKEGQRLKELTEKEKEAMSAKEIELHDATLALQKDQEDFRKTQSESLQKEVNARKERVISKLAGTDPELKKKIEENFGRIKDSEKAQTDEEVAALANEAFNMTGTPKVDPVKAALGGSGGGESGGSDAGSFAESAAGKDIAKAMGLPEVKPAADGAAK